MKKITKKNCLLQKLFVNLHRCSLIFFVMKKYMREIITIKLVIRVSLD